MVVATFAWLLALPPTPSWAAISLDKSWDLGNGVTLERWVDPSAPVHAFVLRFKPASAPATLDVGMPASQLPGEQVTSAIGAAHGAMAAINGDFGHSRPYHATAVDGVLWQTGPQHGENFSIAANENEVFAGKGRPRVVASGPAGPFQVDRWNSGSPSGSEIAGYSPKGGSIESPPGDACSARLKPTGGLYWNSGRKSVGQDYVVDASRCRTKAMRERGMTVLSVRQSASRSQRKLIKGLTVGRTVSVKWTMGWTGTLDTVGGRPMLVENGNNVAPTSCVGPLCSKHPRTAIGVDSRGNLLLVVVDGRISNWSTGLTPRDLGDFFKNKLDARYAMNLDGGGSATMWVKKTGEWCSPKPNGVTNGCLVNYANPGNNYKQREVENAVLILPGPDPGESPPPSGP